MLRAFNIEQHMFVATRDFRITVPALLFHPDVCVFDFAADGKLTKFLVTEESMLEQSPFIDVRFEPLAQAHFWVETRQLFELEGLHDIPRPQPAFIFHHAFVCSTLLARCLSRIDAFISLKEPWILRRLADHKRAHARSLPGPQWREMCGKYIRLLCRNFRTGRIPVIKATNVANNLLVDVLHLWPGRPILYLYSDLESFLVSNLKKAADTRQKMPALAQGFLADCDFAQRFPRMSDPSQLTHLQVCALVWLVSLYGLRGTLELNGNAPVKTLDSQDLLNDLRGSLDSLSRFFGHVPDSADVQRMIDPQVVRTNAKDPSMAYGPEQRQVENDDIRSRHRQELASTMAWIDPLVRELGLMDFMRSRRLTG
jgi:hypothetical protein